MYFLDDYNDYDMEPIEYSREYAYWARIYEDPELYAEHFGGGHYDDDECEDYEDEGDDSEDYSEEE